jgi:hypothetical protein
VFLSGILFVLNVYLGNEASTQEKQALMPLGLDIDSKYLHPSIERTARRQFLLGEYDLAVFAALREVRRGFVS